MACRNTDQHMKAIAVLVILCFLGGSSFAQDVTSKRFEEKLDSLEAEKVKLLEQLEWINAEIAETSRKYGEYQSYQSRVEFQEELERAAEHAYKYAKENELPFVIQDIRLRRDHASQSMKLGVDLHLLSNKGITAISLKASLAGQSEPDYSSADTLEIDFDPSLLNEGGYLHQQWDTIWKYSEDGYVNLIEANISYVSSEDKRILDIRCLVIPYLAMCE